MSLPKLYPVDLPSLGAFKPLGDKRKAELRLDEFKTDVGGRKDIFRHDERVGSQVLHLFIFVDVLIECTGFVVESAGVFSEFVLGLVPLVAVDPEVEVVFIAFKGVQLSVDECQLAV